MDLIRREVPRQDARILHAISGGLRTGPPPSHARASLPVRSIACSAARTGAADGRRTATSVEGLSVLDRPELSNDAIADALAAGYGIAVRKLEFLPIGND